MRKYSDFILDIDLNSYAELDLIVFNRLDLISDDNSLKIDNSKIKKQKSQQLFSVDSCNVKVFVYGEVYYRFSSEYYHDSILSYKEVSNLFIQMGDDFIHHIKGSFTIIILETKNKSVKLFSDQLNPRSVYYYFENYHLVISSSLSAIIKELQEKGIDVIPNNQSIFQYYLYNYIIDNDTFIENIKETQPAQIIVFHNKNIQINNYYAPFEKLDLQDKKLNKNKGLELLKSTLNKTVKLYDKGPDTTAVALTGGFDSRSVLACLGSDFKEYNYYSYGKTGNWDTKIPELIAEKLKLNYKAIELNDDFDNSYSENGLKAVLLGDGVGTISMANYTYVFANFLNNKELILTGLFGSELIKYPSSRGLFINNNMIDVLYNPNKQYAIENQILNDVHQNFFSQDFLLKNKELLLAKVEANQFINNDRPHNEKLFYFLMDTGFRKYFQKELKIQSPWVKNLHPFYDIDLVESIIKTPFLWVYNWTEKKSLAKNLNIHKIYTSIIDQKPILSSFISTHGYKPKHLKSKLYWPLLVFDFYRYKSKMSAESSMTFNSLINNTIESKQSNIQIDNESVFYQMMNNADKKDPQFVKMFSLLFWFHAHDINV